MTRPPIFKPGHLANGGGLLTSHLVDCVCLDCGKHEPGPPNKVRCRACYPAHAAEVARAYQARLRARKARAK